MKQEKTFQDVKKLLLPPQTLVHFDDTKPIIIAACDASPFGVRAVFSQIFTDGLKHPVTYASSLLSPAEQTYTLTKRHLQLFLVLGNFTNTSMIGNSPFTVITSP